MNTTLYRFLTDIPVLRPGQRLVIGLDGLSRSGKTTLTHAVERYLRTRNFPVIVFHLDDYIVERSKRYGTGHEEGYEYYHLQWNTEALRTDLFGKLKSANAISLPKYEERNDGHALQTTDLPDSCVILVEGVFLQRTEWRTYLDTAVYLDCPRDVRFARESESTQTNLHKFTNRYWKGEDYYLSTVHPEQSADLIVNVQDTEDFYSLLQDEDKENV